MRLKGKTAFRPGMPSLTQASELLMALLDVEFHECTPTRVSGSIAADERHHQPWGIVHGGLDTAAIETFATTDACEAAKHRGQQAIEVADATDVGSPRSTRVMRVSARLSSFKSRSRFQRLLRPHRSGRLEVCAVPVQQGRTQQLWQVDIRRPDDDKLIARGQVRLQSIGAAT